MRLRRWAAGLAAAAVVGAGASGAAAATSPLAGTYTTVINGARWTLTIKPNGTFSAAARGTGVTGKITLVKKRATFTGRRGCPVSAKVGTYSYNLVRKTLTFAVIKDPCSALAKILKSHTFTKNE
jgi:hypothetical protein